MKPTTLDDDYIVLEGSSSIWSPSVPRPEPVPGETHSNHPRSEWGKPRHLELCEQSDE